MSNGGNPSGPHTRRFLSSPRSPAAVIDVEGLTKVYGGSRGVKALDGVTFSVPERGVFGFLGPNGAGKTTTIRILATAIEPTEGTVRIGGHDLWEDPLAVKENLGLMPDEVAFYPTLTGMQHLVYYGSFYGMSRAEARKKGSELLAKLGLADAVEKKVKAYSHGMKKRLALAQCLLHDPGVLIMDEPANGLDPAGMRYFRDLIRWLNGEGKTIFLSSHLLSEVEQLCERVGIIDHGRIVAMDTIANLTAHLATDAPSVLRVTARGVTEAVVDAVRALPGVASVETTALGLDVTASPGADIGPEVARTLVGGGAALREMRGEQRSLEDLFLSLTKGGGD